MKFPVVETTYQISGVRDVQVPKMRILCIADVHACDPFMTVAHLQRVVVQANAVKADLICLLGDYAGHLPFARTLRSDVVAEQLATLTAPLGVYAIFGNHDWRDDPEAKAQRLRETHWHKAFDAAGIATLNNRSVPCESDGVPFTLSGIDSQRAYWGRPQPSPGADDLTSALQDTPKGRFTILLAHEPDIFVSLPDHADLTLSGHMHGGQVRPFGRAWYAPSTFGTRYAYGHHVEGARQLVVSGGLGCSSLPIRWNMPPELTLIELS